MHSFFSGNELLEQRRKQPSFCTTYIMGRAGMYSFFSRGQRRDFCPPPGITAAQMKDVAVKHLQRGLQARHEAALFLGSHGAGGGVRLQMTYARSRLRLAVPVDCRECAAVVAHSPARDAS
jgi:hypothetical protein